MRATHVFGLSLLVLTATVAAQVPVNNEPHHRVVYAERRLPRPRRQRPGRRLDARPPARARHRHGVDDGRHPHAHHVAMASRRGIRPPRPLADATVAEYAGKPDSHKVDNVGDAPYQLFAVENLKPAGWSPAAPCRRSRRRSPPRRARSASTTCASRPASTQTTHTHAVPTVAVLISGIVMSEGPGRTGESARAGTRRAEAARLARAVAADPEGRDAHRRASRQRGCAAAGSRSPVILILGRWQVGR